jgi:hypothetical protein
VNRQVDFRLNHDCTKMHAKPEKNRPRITQMNANASNGE